MPSELITRAVYGFPVITQYRMYPHQTSGDGLMMPTVVGYLSGWQFQKLPELAVN